MANPPVVFMLPWVDDEYIPLSQVWRLQRLDNDDWHVVRVLMRDGAVFDSNQTHLEAANELLHHVARIINGHEPADGKAPG